MSALFTNPSTRPAMTAEGFPQEILRKIFKEFPSFALDVYKRQALIAELKDYRYTFTKSGNIQFSASSSRRNDDLVTCLFLAYKNYNIPDLIIPFVGLFDSVQTNKPSYAVKAK